MRSRDEWFALLAVAESEQNAVELAKVHRWFGFNPGEVQARKLDMVRFAPGETQKMNEFLAARVLGTEVRPADKKDSKT